MRWVRMESSSTKVTDLYRRRRRDRLSASLARGSSSSRYRPKSLWFWSRRRSRVRRLCGMRWRILSFSRFSVSDTFTVRSKGSSPVCTFRRVSTTCCITPSTSSTFERKRRRVISIFLASEISCSRFSRGISPIWVRYMRTGSSTRRPSSSSKKVTSSLTETSSAGRPSRSSASVSSISSIPCSSKLMSSLSSLSGLASSSGSTSLIWP